MTDTMTTTDMLRKVLAPSAPPEPVHDRITIPLERAMLCVDCDNVFRANGSRACPTCGSHSSFVLSRALNPPAPTNRLSSAYPFRTAEAAS